MAVLTDPKILKKLETLCAVYSELRYAVVAAISLDIALTREHLRSTADVDEQLSWSPAAEGHQWGAHKLNAWFRGHVTVPEAAAGEKVFLRARTGAPESLLFIDARAAGVFDVNHPVRLVTTDGVAGHQLMVHLEAYAGHNFPGTQPFESLGLLNDAGIKVVENGRTLGTAELVIEREDVSRFVFALLVLHQLAAALDEHSLRRGRITAALDEVQRIVFAKPDEAGEDLWRPALAEAMAVMRPLLESRNGPTAATIGVIGHSHIDTAWLWEIKETWRKCARTFSSVLSLMQQYAEFKFTQSAPYHVETVRRNYPELFERIKQRVAEGRWEINGAMWIEPDCNIPSGESLVRQCLFGQRSTRELFGRTSDTLWQPDVFGYSAALPQILKQSGVSYFCTTKLGWNDTNKFPYDTFHWQGLDGTSVLSHFNTIHCTPDPKTLIEQWNGVQHPDVQDRRLMAFGYGDGGGGPTAEMIELARLTADVEGCPKAEYRTITEFMDGVRDDLSSRLPTWVGELYLELHRGTLTSIASLKRWNRRCEFALRDAELLATHAALSGQFYPHARLRETWKLLLLNQFHDILPGSAIAEVNDEANVTFAACYDQATDLSRIAAATLAPAGEKPGMLVLNSLSWIRNDEVELTDLPEGIVPTGDGVITQTLADVAGVVKTLAVGLALPPLGYRVLPLAAAGPAGPSRFIVDRDTIKTPFACVTLHADGPITSYIDSASGRELVRPGDAFNRLLVGEDVPDAWDNWDIDRDQARKLRAKVQLVRREVIADGPLQLRLRSHYRFGRGSTLTQDTVFHSTTPRVDFDTVVDWHEKYQLLKASFGVAVHAETARHEVQFGHVHRPTHDNTSWDRARFDVCAHKWTDLSETRFGVAFLNDSKYGCTVKQGQYRLTLI
ncbi:MAG: Alpha-mannosidase, partial [Phycisphaerales bacterium]|nr:Alpha-mannosidase [Phycisphaerales bacterium]